MLWRLFAAILSFEMVLSITKPSVLQLGSTPTVQAACCSYTVVDLGPVLGPGSTARSINSAEQITGQLTTASGAMQAFALTPDRVDLGTLPGDIASEGVAINDAGTVAGNSLAADGVTAHPFVWQNSSGLVPLGTPRGATSATAVGMNNAGQVLVNSNIGPAVWTPGSVWRLIEAPAGTADLVASAINNAGQVAGYLSTPSGARAFVWQASKGTRDLGDLRGADSTQATAINDAGEVVGVAFFPDAALLIHVFTWMQGAGVQDIGILPEVYYPGSVSGVNNSGQIIAYGRGAYPQGFRALVWTPGGAWRQLPSLAGFSSWAYASNNHGIIVGTSSTGETLNAVMWRPT